MIKPSHLFVFLSVIASGLGLQAEEKKYRFEEDQVRRLDEGEVVMLEPEGRNILTAAIQINAPTELVWEIMLDHERVLKYVKELRASKLLEAGENWKIVEHKLKMHPLLPSMKYVFREEYGPDYCIEFNRVSGAFRELTGTWELIPQEDDSSVVLMYSTFVDFGWFIPQSWVNRGINKGVPALLNAFREEVISEVEARDAGEEK